MEYIRAMMPGDWAQVRQIYIEGMETGEATFETRAPAWERWNEGHHDHSRLVVCEDERVIAWAALSQVSRRECYAGVAEFSLYVAGSHRGRGLGKRLLRALIESSESNGIWTLYASTFPENTSSLRMQTACGFRVVGRRERIAKLNGVWRDTVLTERRSAVAGQ